MIIGTLQIQLFIPEARSLKDKRLVIQSALTQIRNKFNVSVSEINDKNIWQSSLIGMAVVGDDQKHINRILDKVIDWLRNINHLEVVDYKLEFFLGELC